MGLFTSTMWPTHHVTNLYMESVSPMKYFLLVLRLSSNGQAQTWKALNINVMFSNDIKRMNFLLAALTVLRSGTKTPNKQTNNACNCNQLSSVIMCNITHLNERKSKQAHIPHAPTSLENAVYNEWQFQVLVTGNQTVQKVYILLLKKKK